MIKKALLSKGLISLTLCTVALSCQVQKSEIPNIIVIFADDLGYGDVSYQNPETKIQTPNIDALARSGITFSDAHTASAVCTPSRYGLLTGRYPWRSELKSGVLWGYSKPLIPQDRLTMASMLKQQGYQTACVGKWHLGLDWQTKPGEELTGSTEDQTYGGPKVDFNRPVKNGPITRGFDYYYGISASLDMPPYVIIENDRVTKVPTLMRQKEEFGREGIGDKDLRPEDFLPMLTSKAVDLINDYGKTKKPFFLYFPLPSPHTPVAPSEQFIGKSQAGEYGDFVVEVDWTLGEVMKAIDLAGIRNNTLIIFTSDNGPEVGMIERKEEYNHFSAGILRGCKRDNWEGGHRVPFIASWPGKIKPGSNSDEVICLTDLMSTFAHITGFQLPDNAGEDSYNLLPVLSGEKYNGPLREATIHASVSGKFAIRKGDWVLLIHPGSGGNDARYIKTDPDVMTDSVSLYNLNDNISEHKNVYKDHPEMVKELMILAAEYIKNGRSTPGEPQKNETDNEWKQIEWMDEFR